MCASIVSLWLATLGGVNLDEGADWPDKPQTKLQANSLTRPGVKQSNPEQENWKHLAMAHHDKHNNLHFIWLCAHSDCMLPN